MNPFPIRYRQFCGALLLQGLSLFVFARIPTAPDTSGFPLDRQASDFR